MSPNTNFFWLRQELKETGDRIGFKGNFRKRKKEHSICEGEGEAMPCRGARVSPSIFPFWDLGMNRTGDWDYTLTKNASPTVECAEWSFSSGNFIQTHPRMQRQARQQGEKGRSGLTGSAFCLQTENIAIGFLTLSRVRKFSLSYSCLLRSPVCSVTKY